MVLGAIFDDEFGWTLLNTTVLRPFVREWIGYANSSLFVENVNSLKLIPDMEGPVFAFAHFLPPHPPYLFDRDGNVRKGEYDVRDWKEKALYVDQLVWVNKSMEAAISEILEKARNRSVIILQSDHGSEYSGTFENPDQRFVWERSSNLFAIHLPEMCKGGSAYESITPVNTFRIVFNSCLGTNLPLLEDRTYWSTYERPYGFIPIEELTHRDR